MDSPAKIKMDTEARKKMDSPAKIKMDIEAKIKMDSPAKLKMDSPTKIKMDSPAKIMMDTPAKLKMDSPAKIMMDTKTKFKMDTEARIKLIKLVREHECLYNEEYYEENRDSLKIQFAWEDVENKLNMAKEYKIRSVWSNIRNCFYTLLRNRLLSPNPKKKRMGRYGEELNFLNNYYVYYEIKRINLTNTNLNDSVFYFSDKDVDQNSSIESQHSSDIQENTSEHHKISKPMSHSPLTLKGIQKETLEPFEICMPILESLNENSLSGVQEDTSEHLEISKPISESPVTENSLSDIQVTTETGSHCNLDILESNH